MATLAKFRLEPEPSWKQECKLINDFGFEVYARRKGHWLIVTKTTDSKTGTLSELEQTDLLHRINKIVDFYLDPDSNQRSIRARLNNLGGTLTRAHNKFIQDWITRNMDPE